MNTRPAVAGTVEAFRATFEHTDSEPPYTDEQVIDLWRSEALAAGHRDRTIRERLIVIGAFRKHIGKPLINAQRADLVSFLGRAELAKSSRRAYGSTLRLLYTLLQDEGWRIDNPAGRLPRVKVPLPEPDPLTTEDIQRLLDSGIYGKTRLMVLLAAYQGFRAVEIAAVHGRNVDWDTRRILTADGKGGKEVWRPIHPLVWDAIQAYPRDGYFFPNWKSNQYSEKLDGHVMSNSVSNVLGAAMRRAGIIGHRPHQLRAWFATELLAAGADTMTVQFAMRHASQQTLTRYIKPSQARMRKAMEALPSVEINPFTRGRSAEHSGDEMEAAAIATAI